MTVYVLEYYINWTEESHGIIGVFESLDKATEIMKKEFEGDLNFYGITEDDFTIDYDKYSYYAKEINNYRSIEYTITEVELQ